MPTYDELRAAAEPIWQAVADPPRPLFAVSINTSSLSSGAAETLAALQALCEASGFDVMQTGDTGFAFAEPVVQVTKPGGAAVLYGNVAPERVPEFAAAAMQGVAREFALGVVSGPAADGVAPLADLP